MNVCALIQYQVCDHFGISMGEMLSNRRSWKLSKPRHIAIYLCVELTRMSLPAVGRAFGRDHTTIIYANRKVRGLMNDPDYAAPVHALRMRAVQTLWEEKSRQASPAALENPSVCGDSPEGATGNIVSNDTELSMADVSPTPGGERKPTRQIRALSATDNAVLGETHG